MSALFLAYSVDGGTQAERWPVALDCALRAFMQRFGREPSAVVVRTGSPALGVPVEELATVPAGMIYLRVPDEGGGGVDAPPAPAGEETGQLRFSFEGV